MTAVTAGRGGGGRAAALLVPRILSSHTHRRRARQRHAAAHYLHGARRGTPATRPAGAASPPRAGAPHAINTGGPRGAPALGVPQAGDAGTLELSVDCRWERR